MKLISSVEAANLIKDNDEVMISGFIGTGVPEQILIDIQKKYLKEKAPKDLTLVFCAGQGDGNEKGLNRLAEEGLTKKAIGGHFGLSPRLTKLINENKVEGYNMPQGIMSHLIRASAAKTPYIVSHVGLNTFVDPRVEGGKLNNISKDERVVYINEDGNELLKYYTFKPDVAILRGTYSDRKGNITLDKEALTLDNLAMAQAVKNNGGIVIVQVEDVLEENFDPKAVRIPHILVDYVVKVEDCQNHMQTFGTQYNPIFIKNSDKSSVLDVVPLNDRKVIARRAALELTRDDKVLNYGIGVPEMIANVLNEESQEMYFVPTVEPGIIGGTPQGGLDFGASIYPDMILDQSSQFDFYDGSGIDCAFLGLAQGDINGNINVSKFGPKIAGAGGFINISQNSKKIIFCGTFMVGAKTKISKNKLVIEKEGHIKKFINNVEQITFAGEYAIKNDLYVIYITERAVFDINKETGKLRLIELAPGVDLEKDIINNMEFKPEIAQDLKVMDKNIFNDGKMGLKYN